jgi:hypothetical protein
LSYLGMQLELREEGAVVDMSFYAKQLLEGKNLKEAPPPSTKNTFEVDEGSSLLGDEEKNIFIRRWPSCYLWPNELGLTY